MYLSVFCLDIILDICIAFLFQYIPPMVASSGCPSGYEEKTGDFPESRSDFGIALNLTKYECALKCNGEKSCVSFEHSYKQTTCILNKIAVPSQVSSLDFIFCNKTGIFRHAVNVF